MAVDELVVEGMAALGHPVPEYRLSAAYKMLRGWAYDADTALRIIGRAAHYIERDEPFKAQKVCTGGAPLPVAVSCPEEPFGWPSDLPEFRPGMTAGLMLYATLLAAGE